MNRKMAVNILTEKGFVYLKCNGNSMQPLMSPGDSLHIKEIDATQFRIGDAAFCKINGNLQVHMVGAIDNNYERFLIKNNKGHTNGWTLAKNMYGLCVAVNDKVLVSELELSAR